MQFFAATRRSSFSPSAFWVIASFLISSSASRLRPAISCSALRMISSASEWASRRRDRSKSLISTTAARNVTSMQNNKVYIETVWAGPSKGSVNGTRADPGVHDPADRSVTTHHDKSDKLTRDGFNP